VPAGRAAPRRAAPHRAAPYRSLAGIRGRKLISYSVPARVACRVRPPPHAPPCPPPPAWLFHYVPRCLASRPERLSSVPRRSFVSPYRAWRLFSQRNNRNRPRGIARLRHRREARAIARVLARSLAKSINDIHGETHVRSSIPMHSLRNRAISWLASSSPTSSRNPRESQLAFHVKSERVHNSACN